MSEYRKIKYDETQIKEVKENLMKLGLKPNEVTLFFDMDNTLALFSEFGDDETALSRSGKKGYYKNLKCFEEVPDVISVLQRIGFNVRIISACVNTRYCREEKLEWLHYHVPSIEDEHVIFTINGKDKTSYLESRGYDIKKSILIDDYYKNLIDWMSKGGYAIKKTFSCKERPIPQVNSLVELFAILYELNIL